MTTRTCKICGQEKEESEFKTIKSPNGKYAKSSILNTCLICFRVKDNEKSRSKYPGKRHYHIAYEQNKRAGLLGIGNISADYIKELLGTPFCYYCKCPNDGNFTVEHRQPVSLGGLHSEDNIVATCMYCNYGKRERTESEYILWLSDFAQRFGGNYKH